MKNGNKIPFIIFLCLAAAFNAAAFLLPFERGNGFYTALVFTEIDLILSLLLMTRGDFDSSKKLFYALPVFHVSAVGLILQFVVFFASAGFALSGNTAALLSVLVLAFSVILYVLTMGAAKHVSAMDKKDELKTAFKKETMDALSSLIGLEKDGDIKKSLSDFAEKLRFSDPLSKGAEEQEMEIKEIIASFGSKDKKESLERLNILLTERNRRIKSSK